MSRTAFPAELSREAAFYAVGRLPLPPEQERHYPGGPGNATIIPTPNIELFKRQVFTCDLATIFPNECR